MKTSTILDHIDSGHMALPEFQRGYDWNRDQVRELFDSLSERYLVGGLLAWATESQTVIHRGGNSPEFCYTSTLFLHPYVQKEILSLEVLP